MLGVSRNFEAVLLQSFTFSTQECISFLIYCLPKKHCSTGDQDLNIPLSSLRCVVDEFTHEAVNHADNVGEVLRKIASFGIICSPTLWLLHPRLWHVSSSLLEDYNLRIVSSFLLARNSNETTLLLVMISLWKRWAMTLLRYNLQSSSSTYSKCSLKDSFSCGIRRFQTWHTVQWTKARLQD